MKLRIAVQEKYKELAKSCPKFKDKKLLSFIDSYDEFEEESILAVASKAYGVDLVPLSKFVYEEDEPDKEEIEDALMDTADIISVISDFIAAVKANPKAIEGTTYKSYDETLTGIGDDAFGMFEDSALGFLLNGVKKKVDEQKQEQVNNPYPWNSYFTEGELVETLEGLKACLVNLKEKGVKKFYFEAA